MKTAFRSRLILPILCLAALLSGFNSQAQQKENTVILHVLQTQQNAWNNANLDSFMLYYWHSPELRFVSKKGITKGWQEVFDHYKKAYVNKAAMGTLNFDIKSVELLTSDLAMVVGSWEVQNDKGKQGGYFTLWFRKFKEGWRIVLDHTS